MSFPLMNRAGGTFTAVDESSSGAAPPVTVYWSSVSGNMVVCSGGGVALYVVSDLDLA